MTKKKARDLKSKFTPPYCKRAILAVCIITVLWLAILTGAIIAFCLITFYLAEGSQFRAFLFMVVMLTATLAAGIANCVILELNQKRLTKERIEEVEKEFSDLPVEDAASALVEKNIITESGFMISEGEYAGNILPFEEAVINVYSANVYTKILTVAVICNAEGKVVAEYILNGALYNLIIKKNLKLSLDGESRLLISNKKEFVKSLLGVDSESQVVAFFVGALGRLLLNSSKGTSVSKDTVFSVLNKEIYND